MGDELTIGTGMMKAFPIQSTEAKKAMPPTEIISSSSNNRQAVTELRDKNGYEILKVIERKMNNADEKERKPPTWFLDIPGFNKMDVTFVVKRGDETETIKNERKFNELVQNFASIYSDSKVVGAGKDAPRTFSEAGVKKMTEFADQMLKEKKITRETRDEIVNSAKNRDWTALYNILDKNKLLNDFMNWMSKEINRLTGSQNGASPSELQTAYITGNLITDKLYKELSEQVEKAKEIVGKKD